MLYAALLRFLYNGSFSLWYDEAASVGESKDYLSILFERGNGAFYLLLLRIWRDLFGDSAAAMRSLSGGIDLVSITLIYLIAKTAYRSRSVGLLAMFLYASMPLIINHAREVRMYPLFTCMFLGSIYLLFKFLHNSSGWRLPVMYALAVTLGVLSHTYFVFFAAGLALAAFFAIGNHPLKKSHADLRCWLKLHGLLFLGAFIVLLRYLPKDPDPWTYIKKWSYTGRVVAIPFVYITGILYEPWPWTVLSDGRVYLSWLVLSVLIGTCLVQYFSKDYENRRTSLIFGTLLTVPVGLIIFLPIRFEIRYMIPALGVAAIVGSWLFVDQLGVGPRKLWITLIATTIFLFFATPKNLDLFELEPEPWNELCQELQRNPPVSNVIYVDSSGVRKPLNICYKGPATIEIYSKEKLKEKNRNDEIVLVVRFVAKKTESRVAMQMADAFQIRQIKRFPPKLAVYTFQNRVN